MSADVTVVLTYTDDEAARVAHAVRMFNRSVTASYDDHDRMNLIESAIDMARTDTRRLVVIDPEDREQVERLEFLYIDCAGREVTIADSLQAALREFANPAPPRPEEPTGWGAVVEDSDGHYWTLIAPEAQVWANYSEGLGRYDDIEAVRIVHEGVQP